MILEEKTILCIMSNTVVTNSCLIEIKIKNCSSSHHVVDKNMYPPKKGRQNLKCTIRTLIICLKKSDHKNVVRRIHPRRYWRVGRHYDLLSEVCSTQSWKTESPWGFCFLLHYHKLTMGEKEKRLKLH